MHLPPSLALRAAKFMDIADRRQRTALTAHFKKQSRLGEALTDPRQCDSRNRLGLQQLAPLLRRDGKRQLEILPVAQGALQGRALVLHLLGGGANRNPFGEEDRSAAAFFANVIHVGSPAGAAVA